MSDVATSVLRIARKVHRCCECRKEISVGCYHLSDSVPPWEQDKRGQKFDSYRVCLNCMARWGYCHSGIQDQYRKMIEAARVHAIALAKIEEAIS